MEILRSGDVCDLEIKPLPVNTTASNGGRAVARLELEHEGHRTRDGGARVGSLQFKLIALSRPTRNTTVASGLLHAAIKSGASKQHAVESWSH